jgi:hypothetical protein
MGKHFWSIINYKGALYCGALYPTFESAKKFIEEINKNYDIKLMKLAPLKMYIED